MSNSSEKKPALFIPIKGKWLIEAFDYFKNGKDRLYFVSNAKALGALARLSVKKIYFKMKGDTSIKATADFLEVTAENPILFRLPAGEPGKYYYGFRELRWITEGLPLNQLHYFASGKTLRNDVPGACVIVDPNLE